MRLMFNKYIFESKITFIILFVLIISSFWNYSSVTSGDFTNNQIFQIIIYISAILIFQSMLLYIIYRTFLGLKYIDIFISLMASLILSVNLINLNLIHIELFSSLEIIYKILIFVASIYVFYIILDVSKTIFVRIFVLFSSILLLVVTIAMSFLPEKTSNYEAITLAGLRPVSFSERPNIYFLGFDALTPEVIANKHLKLEVSNDVDNLIALLLRKLPTTRMRVLPKVRLPIEPQLDSEPLLVIDDFDDEGCIAALKKTGSLPTRIQGTNVASKAWAQDRLINLTPF